MNTMKHVAAGAIVSTRGSRYAMPMKNRIREFVDAREQSVYAFWQKTGISRTTAYDLYHNSDTYPGKNVMDAICLAYTVQPGDLIYWEPPSVEGKDD